MTDGAGVTTTGAGVSTGMGRNEDTTVGAGVVTGLDIGSGVVGFGEGASVVGLGDGSAVGFHVGRLVCRVGGGVGLGDGGWLGCLLGGSVHRRARSEVMSGRSSTAMLFVDDGWIVGMAVPVLYHHVLEKMTMHMAARCEQRVEISSFVFVGRNGRRRMRCCCCSCSAVVTEMA